MTKGIVRQGDNTDMKHYWVKLLAMLKEWGGGGDHHQALVPTALPCPGQGQCSPAEQPQPGRGRGC